MTRETYLGYQVRDLPSCREELEEWLARHPDTYFAVWSNTPVGGTGIDYGIVAVFPWDEGEGEHITSFRDEGDTCRFSSINNTYVLRVAEAPTDAWGSTATYDDGITLAVGVSQIGYEDTSYSEFESWFRDLLYDTTEAGEASAFAAWMRQEHPEYVSTVGERLIQSSNVQDWYFYTTILAPDDPEWHELVRAFGAEVIETDEA